MSGFTGSAQAGVVFQSSLVGVADGWWDRSVSPDKLLSNERDGFVASGFESPHWSWSDGCAAPVQVTANQGQPRYRHRKGAREVM